MMDAPDEPVCSEGDCSPFDIGLVVQKGFNNLSDEGRQIFKILYGSLNVHTDSGNNSVW